MNDQITRAFVQQFADSYVMYSQQMESRLQATIVDIGGVEGTSFTANNMGATQANEVTDRHGDTVWNDNPTDVRVAMMRDFDWSTPIDKYDVPKLKANPQGSYTKNGSAALNRKKDDVIYQALIGPSITRTAEAAPYSTIVLPSNQKIVDGGTGMTKAKIITTKKRFRQNEADEYNGEELFFLYTGDMLEDILSDTTLTSADFMTVKMLQDGAVNQKWCGFTWIPYESVNVNTAGTIATTVAYARSGAQFGMGLARSIDIGPRRDKRNLTQIYIGESYGATRTQEQKVVSVDYVI